jgi:hypothetical protein
MKFEDTEYSRMLSCDMVKEGIEGQDIGLSWEDEIFL